MLFCSTFADKNTGRSGTCVSEGEKLARAGALTIRQQKRLPQSKSATMAFIDLERSRRSKR